MVYVGRAKRKLKMNTIKPTNNINDVTNYFLSCGYYYRKTVNNIETSIVKNHSVFTVSQYDIDNKEGLGSISFDRLTDAKNHFKLMLRSLLD
jgi:hypothetical protein